MFVNGGKALLLVVHRQRVAGMNGRGIALKSGIENGRPDTGGGVWAIANPETSAKTPQCSEAGHYRSAFLTARVYPVKMTVFGTMCRV